MSYFIKITKSQFESYLPQPFELVHLHNSWEYVYDIPTIDNRLKIRIFSSIDINTNISREIGEDAIRCVLIDSKSGKPINKGKRTHRMKNWKLHLTEKLESLKQDIKSVKICLNCGSVMRFIEKGEKRFYGCINYPKCNFTLNYNINEEKDCPLCRSPMILRNSIYGKFWGCSQFPNCFGKLSI